MKKYDAVRGFGWTLPAAMLIYLLTLVYPVYDSVFDPGGNGLLLYLYVNSVSYGGWLLPLFACLPFASSYVLERKSGFQRTAVLKYGARSYVRSKVLVSIFSGGLALAGGLVLFWLLLAATGHEMTADETLIEYVFLLVILMSFLPWLLFPNRLQFGNEWGKALNTLSQTDVKYAYGIGISFPRKLTMMFSPLSMYAYGLLFKWLIIATFAQVMFAVNIVFHKRVGLPLVLFYAVGDLSIELMLSSEFYRFSLVSLSRLNTLGTGYQSVLPTLRYRVIVIPVVWGVSTALCYVIATRSNLLESF